MDTVSAPEEEQSPAGRAAGDGAAAGSSTAAGSSKAASVVAPKAKRRKRAGANRWYEGVVQQYHGEDGSYTIAYDDGVVESGVMPVYVIVKE